MKASHDVLSPSGRPSVHHGYPLKYVYLFVGIWTLLIISSLVWTSWVTRANLKKLALVQARALSGKDVIYRRWGSASGGIYVNRATGIVPNPLLRDHPNRDIETTSGLKLTLVNPEYMSRMVYDMEERDQGIKTGMTSLDPLNPGNRPDAWELRALHALQNGTPDVSIIEDRPEGRVLRLMTPLMAEQDCLQCHQEHGFVLGEICGGLTLQVPMKPYEARAGSDLFNQGFSLVLIWLFGLLGIGLGFRKYALSERGRHSTEKALIEAKLSAESANRAKSDFLANMSHEVRTPINAIIGMTELTLDMELSRHQRDCLETVKSSADSLLILINDILDFSKIEAGMLEFEKVPFSLSEVIEGVMRTLAITAHKKGLELISDVHAEVPDGLIGDPLRLRQILLNLLGNAVKFTERGEVVLRVKPTERQEDACRLSFDVVDSGIGIPAELQPKLFSNFSQADSSTTRKFGGSGLGLAISKALTEGLGGRISMRSTTGEGTFFTFDLPFMTDPVGESIQIEDWCDKKILIVDDHPETRQVMLAMLNQMGIVGSAIDSGDSAIQKLHEARHLKVPFLMVFIDCNMPGMDGFTTTEIIREHLDPQLPIVMSLTTDNLHEGIERCRELAVNSYLVKPVSAGSLRQALRSVFDGDKPVHDQEIINPNPSHPVPGAYEIPSVYSRHLLLAEDNTFNQKLALALARKKSWKMTVVNNGREAVKAVTNGSFDLVLMDVQMSEIDGLEATRRIRQRSHSTTPRLPIIGMTAHAMPGDRERCLASGMDDYVAKPIRPEIFYEVVERYLGKSSEPPESTPMSVQPDQVFTRNLQDNRLLMTELVKYFLDDYPQLLEKLKTSMARNQLSEIEFLAHNLKSLVGFFNENAAGELARRLEACAHTGNMGEGRELLSRLEYELERVRTNLRAI